MNFNKVLDRVSHRAQLKLGFTCEFKYVQVAPGLCGQVFYQFRTIRELARRFDVMGLLVTLVEVDKAAQGADAVKRGNVNLFKDGTVVEC